MAEHSVIHARFVIDRRYDAPPAVVFSAFSDPDIHDRWFVRADNWPIASYRHDFRVGGQEGGEFSPDGKLMIVNETTYLDIIVNERIISAYTMYIDGRRISVSVATVELQPDGGGTRLTYTEQGAFLDGLDQPADREAGCKSIFDALGKELEQRSAAA